MSEPASRRSRHRPGYRELMHGLNQRYHREWERAEALEAELRRLRGWRGWPGIAWLRRLKRWLRPPSQVPEPPLAMEAIPYEPPGGPAEPRGTVSIIIPFR